VGISVAMLVVAVASALAAPNTSVAAFNEGVQTASGTGLPRGWTRLPLPPKVKDGATPLWAGTELVAWGGCAPRSRQACRLTQGGFGFDPQTREWRALPQAPRPGAYAQAVWTGSEAIFLGVGRGGHRLHGEAYDPASAEWRLIPDAPLAPRHGAVVVWTGSEVIVWGGGRRGSGKPRRGAAYDPAAERWRRVAIAPIGLNLASGMWTGQDMLVFGSLLDRRNRAATKTSVGAAYDPATDAWRRIPRSALSPQATSAAWVGNRMVAWDYEVHSQNYNPKRNRWSRPIRMPLRFDECYPNSVAVGERVFAFFCGRAALYDASANDWRRIHGGMLKATVGPRHDGRALKRWRFADLVPAGDVVFLLAEGITLTGHGVPCYRCPGSPHSFWAYRPRG
jgi:hypothetical protein